MSIVSVSTARHGLDSANAFQQAPAIQNNASASSGSSIYIDPAPKPPPRPGPAPARLPDIYYPEDANGGTATSSNGADNAISQRLTAVRSVLLTLQPDSAPSPAPTPAPPSVPQTDLAQGKTSFTL